MQITFRARVNAAEQLLGEAALARLGDRVALLCGDEAVSYRDLARRVQSSAARSSALGCAAAIASRS
jgi:non-ribosomal peptide synthetase component E (peptide arylation enzyme)